MKDFTLRNDTRLLLRNDPVPALKELIKGRRVLFVYGSKSAKKNGCLDDVKNAVSAAGGSLYELGNASRELSDIERVLKSQRKTKLNSLSAQAAQALWTLCKADCFWDITYRRFVGLCKGQKNPYGLEKLPLILMPTYPSSGSEYGLGTVLLTNGSARECSCCLSYITFFILTGTKFFKKIHSTAYCGAAY